jgi:hypothetical protein
MHAERFKEDYVSTVYWTTAASCSGFSLLKQNAHSSK